MTQTTGALIPHWFQCTEPEVVSDQCNRPFEALNPDLLASPCLTRTLLEPNHVMETVVSRAIDGLLESVECQRKTTDQVPEEGGSS